MSPLEELKESVRENIEVHRRMGYDIGVARNEARLAAIESLEARVKELETHVFTLKDTGWRLMNELDTEAFSQVGPPNAELIYQHAGDFRQALRKLDAARKEGA